MGAPGFRLRPRGSASHSRSARLRNFREEGTGRRVTTRPPVRASVRTDPVLHFTVSRCRFSFFSPCKLSVTMSGGPTASREISRGHLRRKDGGGEQAEERRATVDAVALRTVVVRRDGV